VGEEVETFMRLELGTDSYSLLTRLWQRLSLPLTDWLITGQGSDMTYRQDTPTSGFAFTYTFSPFGCQRLISVSHDLYRSVLHGVYL